MFNNLKNHLMKTIAHHPLALFSSAFVLTATFTIITGFFVITHNVNSSFSSVGRSVQLSVYLSDKITQDEKSILQSKLSELEEFEKPQFTSKKQAAEYFKKSMSAYAPDLLNEDHGNPLPASFDVPLKSSIGSSLQVSVLSQAANLIEKLAGVDGVSYGQDWVANYATVVKSFKISSWLLLFVLFTGGMIIVSNAIKNSLSQRREEIEILELVGATSTEIRTPFVLEGAVIGLLSSIMAVTLTYFVYLSQSGLIQKELGFLGLAGGLQFLPWVKIISLILSGICLGALGSYITVRKINTGWAASGQGGNGA